MGQYDKELQGAILHDANEAKDLANAAAAFLIQRAEMIGTNPLICFIMLQVICEINIEDMSDLPPEKLRMLTLLTGKPQDEAQQMYKDAVTEAVQFIKRTTRERGALTAVEL